MKKDIGLLYVCVQKKLLENSKQNLISKKFACYLLANQFHVPSQLRYAILQEMQNFGMIKPVNRQIIEVEGIEKMENFEVKELKQDLNDTSAIYEEVGMW